MRGGALVVSQFEFLSRTKKSAAMPTRIQTAPRSKSGYERFEQDAAECLGAGRPTPTATLDLMCRTDCKTGLEMFFEICCLKTKDFHRHLAR